MTRTLTVIFCLAVATPALGAPPADAADPAPAELVTKYEGIAWNGLSTSGWVEAAEELRAAALAAHEAGAPEEVRFGLLAQTGRAVQNGQLKGAPYYRENAGGTVSWYWLQAAALASQRPELMTTLPEGSLRTSVQRYVDDLASGTRTAPGPLD